MTYNIFVYLLLFKIGILCILFEPLHSQTRFYTTRTATQCMSTPGAPRLDFSSCDPGHMILIHEAFQGISQTPGVCGYRRGDCLAPVTPETEAKLYQCIGAHACQLDINVSWMPQCRAYSDYNIVIYTCVAKEDVMDMCEIKQRLLFRTGYIISNGYPANYMGNRHCHCNITTEPDQKLLLTFSDFAIEWSEDCYKDVLQIKDGDDDMSRCGRLVRNHNVTSETNRMELQWRTDGWKEHKGFWLQVEALGSIRIECGTISPSDHTSSATARPGTLHPTEQTTIASDLFTKDNAMDFGRRYPGSALDLGRFNNINDIHLGRDKADSNMNDVDRNIHDVNDKTDVNKDTHLQTDVSNMEIEFDLFLTKDFYDNYVTREDQSRDSIFDIGSHRDITRGPKPTFNSEPDPAAPLFVVSPTVGIIIGCSLLVVLALLLLCVALWCKKHRKKEAITKQTRTTESRLMRHTFPRINSPRPRMHTPRQRTHVPRPHVGSPRPSASHHFQCAYQYPDSPLGSCHSFGSDFSIGSGRSGIKRGERVRKDRHYKRQRRSPRLDTSKLPPEEHHQLDSDT